MIVVRASGPLATIQDGGRSLLGHLGVGAAGAADPNAFALANRLVGNADGTAAIEVTLGGLTFECIDACVVAMTGAPCPATVSAGPSLGFAAPLAFPAGALVRLAAPPRGLRTYVAVRGGIDVPPVLGSRSFDTLGRLGPPPLQPGDALTIGPDPASPLDTDLAPTREREPIVRLWPGPRLDWFADALGALTSAAWTVRSDSDRVGVRLSGTPLRRARTDELPSEGIVTGAVQVPHDGQPIVMLADHPVTGGYPVVAVADPDDITVLAQARPGTQLRFVTHRGRSSRL